MAFIITWLYIYLFRGQLKDGSGCGNFSLRCRPIGDLLLLSVLWLGYCVFQTFPISMLNFIFLRLNHDNYCRFIIVRWIPIFMGSWIQVNHEFNCSTNYEFAICLVCRDWENPGMNINKMRVFLIPPKIITMKKCFHGSLKRKTDVEKTIIYC